VTALVELTPLVVITTEVDDFREGTITVAGTAAALGLLLVRLTAVPPGPPYPFKKI
jgi:hypothetical protein